MKTYIRLIIISTVLVSCTVMCSQKKQQLKINGVNAPEVEHPTISLKPLSPTNEKQDEVVELSQDTTQFDYGIILDNKNAFGQVDLNGVVSEFTKNYLLFKNVGGGTAKFLYHLTFPLVLNVDKGETIKLTAKEGIEGSNFNYILGLYGEKRVILSSAALSGENPLQVTINKDMVLQQAKFDSKDVLLESRSQTQHQSI
jgi:hypothetical protein